MKEPYLTTIKSGKFTPEEFRNYMINRWTPPFAPGPYEYKRAKLKGIFKAQVALYERMDEVHHLLKVFKKDKEIVKVLEERYQFLDIVNNLIKVEEVKVIEQLT